MKSKDLGSKKMNNKQSDEKLTENKSESKTKKPLNLEVEANKSGNKKVVERARNVNHDYEVTKTKIDSKVSSKPSTASEEMGKKMVENQDKNSDVVNYRKNDL